MTPLAIPSIDYTAYKFWVDILILLVVGANAAYTWWANRVKINNKRFVALEKTVDAKANIDDVTAMIRRNAPDCVRHRAQTTTLENTVHGLEIELRHMPSRTEIHTLNTGINSLTEKIGKLEGRFEGVNRVADIMNKFLIEQGSSKA